MLLFEKEGSNYKNKSEPLLFESKTIYRPYLRLPGIFVHFNDRGEDSGLHLVIKSLYSLLVVLEQVPEAGLREARLFKLQRQADCTLLRFLKYIRVYMV